MVAQGGKCGRGRRECEGHSSSGCECARGERVLWRRSEASSALPPRAGQVQARTGVLRAEGCRIGTAGGFGRIWEVWRRNAARLAASAGSLKLPRWICLPRSQMWLCRRSHGKKSQAEDKANVSRNGRDGSEKLRCKSSWVSPDAALRAVLCRTSQRPVLWRGEIRKQAHPLSGRRCVCYREKQTANTHALGEGSASSCQGVHSPFVAAHAAVEGCCASRASALQRARAAQDGASRGGSVKNR